MNDKKLKGIEENIKKIRKVFDVARSSMDIPDRVKWRQKIKQFQRQRLQQPQQNQGIQHGIQQPQIPERFPRPMIFQRFLQPQQPRQPQVPTLTENERIALRERESQLRC